MIATIALLAASLQAQVAGADKADPALDFMKSKAAAYQFTPDGSKPLKLQVEPAFRMGRQPASTVMEGAIFFWLGDDGRPEAAAQIFQVKDDRDSKGLWVHEFISLSPAGFAGELGGRPSWSPRQPGVEFRAIPKAPRPASTTTQRSTQMRALAREFGSTDYSDNKRWTELRLLPTPIARYGKPGSPVVDGGLFAFVIGTDPEAFVFIEARAGKDGPEWQYAFAPMSCFQLKGTHSGRPIWDIPYRKDAADPSLPYFLRLD